MPFKALIMALALSPLSASPAFATPEYAARTGKQCEACHAGGAGGALNERGAAFKIHGYKWVEVEDYAPILPMGPGARAAIGLAHFIGAFLWFGTILYVHILLRPAYAAKGLPRGEMRMGLASMMAVGASGLLLTLSRINGAGALVDTKWGLLLSAKIAIYMAMLASAVLVVTLLNPRLRKERARAAHPKDGVFGPRALSSFDGKAGSPAYIAFEGNVYDVSASTVWKNGVHFRKHAAGEDLSSAISMAPHGPEKLAGMRRAGTYDPALPARLTGPQRIFYVVAYTNLGLVFIALAVIAAWRWGV